MVEHYGAQWYLENGAAVQFIIENEYSNKEREERPYMNEYVDKSMFSHIMW